MTNHRRIATVAGAIATIAKQSFVICLGMLLFAQTQLAVAAGQAATQQQPAQTQPSAEPAAAPAQALPSQPAAHDEIPSAPVPQSLALEAQNQSSQSTQQNQSSQPAEQQSAPQQPVGTAAAPYEKPTGVPGSRPAGAVIAPAKQRRVRAIVIRVALVLAGAGAVGAVVGLSKASHSQP